MKNQKGFSLVELLVVVIIIAIIAAIAIPNLLASRRAANEASAVNNLRTISSAQQTHYALSGNDYGTYGELTTAGLVDAAWADGVVRSTYTFPAISLGTGDDGFCATATTTDTSSRSYAVSHRNAIYQLAGTTAPTCDANTGVISTGTVVQ